MWVFTKVIYTLFQKMQGLGSRTKTTLTVFTGLTASLGLALLTRKTASRFFLRYLSSSRKPDWKMKITVASTENQCNSFLHELKQDLQVSKVLGFDCEWAQTDNKRNRVALIQLATREGNCGLFQIQLYSFIPTLLKDILTDKSILKVGVDPHQDAKYLHDDYGIDVVGTFDIRHLVEGRDSVGGLAAVVNAELGIEMSKDLAVRVSNWEARDLTPDQAEYAANDALCSLFAFNKLIDKKVKVPFFGSKADQWTKIYEHCEPLIDNPFRDKKRILVESNERPSHILERKKSGQPYFSAPTGRGKRSYSACPRKSPLYENAYMLAPDGDVLCTCDSKKAEWYVSKGLATLVEREPLKIQLTFEPSGRVTGTSAQYYTLVKENQCVACGRKDSYLRKKIVPHEYRRYFPDCMKKHQSHDVLLLCTPCHAKSNAVDLGFRLKLAEMCNAPIAADENSRVVEDNKNKLLRSAARALVNKSNQLPEKRRKELTDFIRENCQLDVTPDLLNCLKDMDIMVVNEDFAPHGLLVVAYFAKDGVSGLTKLEKMWREHFLFTMEPQYLPPLWSVDHYHENEREFSFDSDFLNRIKLSCLAES